MQPLKALLAILYTTWVSDPITTLTEVEKGSYKTYELSEPAFKKDSLRFIVAGDCYGSSYATFESACHRMALEKADFIILGGDLAYTAGLVKPVIYFMPAFIRWNLFFKALPPGVPLLIAPGNHDVKGKRGSFYTYFPQLKPTYQHLTWPSLLDLLLLDTNHGYPMKGEQTTFVENHLKSSQSPWKLAVYHVPAYPARHPADPISEEVRALFVPLFDTYHLDVAFENHAHCYKKTYPLKGGMINPHGTYYLGDGCLGVIPHKAKPLAYIEESGAFNFFYVVTLDAKRCLIEGVLINGNRFVAIELFKEPGDDHLLEPAS